MKGQIKSLNLPVEAHVAFEHEAGLKKWHEASCNRLPHCKVWVEAVGRRGERRLVFRHGVDRVLPLRDKRRPDQHTIVIGQSGRSYTIRHVDGCPEPVFTCLLAVAAREQLDRGDLGRPPGEYRCQLNQSGQLRIGHAPLTNRVPVSR